MPPILQSLRPLTGRLHLVEHRRLPLSEQLHERQVKRGLYVVERGEPFAVPIDRKSEPTRFLERDVWRHDLRHGTYRAGARFAPRQSTVQRRILRFLRDNVHRDIPYWYYLATLGHDLHVSQYAVLYGHHWHAGWVDPFTQEFSEPADHTFETHPGHPGHVARRVAACERHFAVTLGLDPGAGFSRDCKSCDVLSEPIAEWRLRARMLNWGKFGGFAENLGLLNQALITSAFVSEEVDELVSSVGSEFADFDFHEVGTDATAESNAHTALQVTSGIARATGTPADEDPDYANDGTITADATESWEEHGLFNNSAGAAMMDRNLTGGQAVNSSDQVTYQGTWTFNPET